MLSPQKNPPGKLEGVPSLRERAADRKGGRRRSFIRGPLAREWMWAAAKAKGGPTPVLTGRPPVNIAW